jgi:hypothetical protein
MLVEEPSRPVSAERKGDDVGDVVSRNGALIVQVRNWRDVGRACLDGADADERHALGHPTAALGVAMVRRRGGRWVVTMTPDNSGVAAARRAGGDRRPRRLVTCIVRPSL